MSIGTTDRFTTAYTAHNKVRLVRGGKDYFDTLRSMIENANRSVHLQTYIFSDDETGVSVARVLIDAARRGVEVFLLLDGYASRHLSKTLIHEMKSNGVQFRWFEPIFRSRYFYFGRRLHHKVVVTDGLFSLVGGVNVTNRYNDMPGEPAWLDWALFTEGEASTELFYVCQDLWNKSGWGKKKKELLHEKAVVNVPGEECYVRVRRGDWVRSMHQVNRSYMEMFRKAEKEMIIMSSYFLPGRIFRKRLASASKRGVKIKVIAAGKSDVMMAKHAERYIYRWIFKNKIELYEYLPTVLHGKMSTYDKKWVTVGSYNVNNISAYASIELNVDVLNENFAVSVHDTLEDIILHQCKPISEEEFELHNTFIKRVWQWTCYQIIRLVFHLFTFYFSKRGM